MEEGGRRVERVERKIKRKREEKQKKEGKIVENIKTECEEE